MNNDFQTILEFLDRCGPEVTGRSAAVLENSETDKLQRFAAGESTEDERAEICAFLQLHPTWVRWVADRVKLARTLTRQSALE